MREGVERQNLPFQEGTCANQIRPNMSHSLLQVNAQILVFLNSDVHARSQQGTNAVSTMSFAPCYVADAVNEGRLLRVSMHLPYQISVNLLCIC